MLFNSIEFLFFLPVVFILYWFVFHSSLRIQNGLVLVASYFFYGWWSWEFMLLLALSTLLDFLYGFWVASPQKSKARLFLWLGVINNLGILGVFKYYNFFIVQFQQGLDLLGLHTNPALLKVALPIGISFYTFHGMSYVFDIYRGKMKPVNNFIDYAVFVSFFPLLVAGPIERANHLLPQIQKKRVFDYNQAIAGCRLILWGMVKKVVIADNLAGMVDDIFDHHTDYNGSFLIVGAIAFSFQIYGDFSGYSDIALGTAKIFGFELLSNFKFPYFSRDIAEFWRRWHISLSSWFRDYLYIPLGGSRNGKLKAVRNTFIIFLVSGFWHGASWNFIVWGLVHACAFMPLLIRNQNRQHVSDIIAEHRSFPSLKEVWNLLTTFLFVTFAWIFFRAENITHALNYIKHGLVNIMEDPIQLFRIIQNGKTAFIYIIPLVISEWYLRKNERILKMPENKILRRIIYCLLLGIVFIFFGKNQSFIYFQF